MVKLIDFAEIQRLLDELAPHEGELTGNELELYRSLRAKYQEPVSGQFDDKICLELLLRNIGIRRAHGLAPQDAGARRIDLPRVDQNEDS
ncbi:MAG: hypothetical protein AAF495_11945 [Pseudomonadota bacterium]